MKATEAVFFCSKEFAGDQITGLCWAASQGCPAAFLPGHKAARIFENGTGPAVGISDREKKYRKVDYNRRVV